MKPTASSPVRLRGPDQEDGDWPEGEGGGGGVGGFVASFVEVDPGVPGGGEVGLAAGELSEVAGWLDRALVVVGGGEEVSSRLHPAVQSAAVPRPTSNV